jgi:NTP pyrophosphatase (non-canonical NTP hydrolase)
VLEKSQEKGRLIMEWSEYRENCKRWRMDLEGVEYICTLLLGIPEEWREHVKERKNGTFESQVEEYGDMLFNIAELWNYLEEMYKDHSGRSNWEGYAPDRCVEVVRKLYFRDKLMTDFICEAWAIAEQCMEYVPTITAGYAMVASVAKMKERHG